MKIVIIYLTRKIQSWIYKFENHIFDTVWSKMSTTQVFVQLDELLATEDGDAEWKETARWIKYEEDVEEGSARWGRPHVASLSFHSLLNLRRCLETGVVLLDLDEKDLPGVAYRYFFSTKSLFLQLYKLLWNHNGISKYWFST